MGHDPLARSAADQSSSNGVDQKINVLLRSTLEVLTSFGDGGRQPGQFLGVHDMDTNSRETSTLPKLIPAHGYSASSSRVSALSPGGAGVPWPRKFEGFASMRIRARNGGLRELTMKQILLGLAGVACCVVGIVAQAKINPTESERTCNMCPGYYIPLSELQAYTKKAVAEELLNHRSETSKSARRTSASAWCIAASWTSPRRIQWRNTTGQRGVPIIEGTATLMLGPDITNMKRRPATQQTVRNTTALETTALDSNGVTTTSSRATSSSFQPAPATGSPRSTTTSTT